MAVRSRRRRDVALVTLAWTAACGSHHSGIVAGPADAHCAGVTPPAIGTCVTNTAPEAAKVAKHVTGGNDGTDGYGSTMYGSSGDDDACKYHVAWSADDVAAGQDVIFTVDATVLAQNAPIGDDALPRIEALLGTTHPAPNSDQRVVSVSPGKFRVGPVRFDAAGQWTVRFHFYEACADVAGGAGASPHGHAAFFVDVP